MEIVTAIAEFFKLLNLILPRIFALIDIMQKHHEAELKRLQDAQAAEEAAYQKATTSQAKREQANLAAFQMIMDVAKKDLYNIILKALNDGQPEKVLSMMKKINNAAVDDVLFNKETSNEVKAMYLTQIHLS